MIHPEDYPYISDPRDEIDDDHRIGLNVNELLDLQDWMDELIHHVYVTGNINDFENALEEVSYRVQVKIPVHPPKLRGN